MDYFRDALCIICDTPDQERFFFTDESRKHLSRFNLAVSEGRWTTINAHARPVIEALNKMRRCLALANIAKSLMYNIDFHNSGQATLTVVAEIDKEATSGTFQIDKCDEARWKLVESFCLSLTLPHLFRARSKGESFVQATLEVE